LDNAHRGGINVYFNYELFLKGKKPGEYVKPYQFKRIEKSLIPLSIIRSWKISIFLPDFGRKRFNIPKNLFLIDRSTLLDMNTNKYVTEEEFLRDDIDVFGKLINGFGGNMIYPIVIRDKEIRLNGIEVSLSDFLKASETRNF